MHSRAGRLLRGGLTGSVATIAAALSHAVAGGMPSALALGTGLVFGVLFGTLAIGRRTSPVRLAAVIAGTQLAFHLVFSYLTPAVGAVAGSHHATMSIGAAASAERDVAMWIAHVVAGVLTLWYLRRGETAVWRMLREALLRVLAAPSPVRVGIVRVPIAPVDAPTLVARVARLPRRRGPPVPRFA